MSYGPLRYDPRRAYDANWKPKDCSDPQVAAAWAHVEEVLTRQLSGSSIAMPPLSDAEAAQVQKEPGGHFAAVLLVGMTCRNQVRCRVWFLGCWNMC